MSSDESTSSTSSTSSSTSSTVSILTESRQTNFNKPDKWESNLIGNFVLNLYHRLIITPSDDWCVKKSEMRKEYSELVTTEKRRKLKELSGTDDIGTLLHRGGFLINTMRGSPFYKISYKTLFEFRNNKTKELDNRKINSDSIDQETTSDKESDSILLNLLKNKPIDLEDNFEIDLDEAKKPLEYQGSTIQRRDNNFCSTNMSCCICQEDFTTMESFEDHIQIHGEDTDFEFLTKMDKFNSPIFTMSYRLCKNSHNFCFEFETGLQDLIIEKIIIVQSRSFFYVHNMRVPYKCLEDGINRFFVDSHLFTRHVEQPIVVICHMEDNKDSRMIEQHHFMRTEEFPKVGFSINPYRLPDKKLFKPKFELADYYPPKEIQDALKDDFYYENLMKTSNEFRDYIRNGKNLQPQTIGASLNILLQIEDMDTIREYLSLRQKNIKLRSFGDEYSFKLKPKQRIFLENILSAYDEVILTKRTDIFTNTEEILKLMMQNKSDIYRMKNTFVGLIQNVNTGRISFKCDQKIDIHGSYTVIFRPSRLNFRYQYRSLQLLSTNMDFLKKFLFPAKIISMPLSTISLNLYNTNITAEQLQAVRNIAEGPRNDATYIIFGPPGTGKTTTLVESILQVLRKPDTKILVTASSNSACDEVALRLCQYLNQLDIKRAMVRIYSRSSEIRTDTIDDELLENSNMYNGQFYPDVEILHEYRVVICTLSIVSKLATGKFGRRENGATLYTHVFIDEVAASMEVEALMAITTILTPKSCLIISGDHKQLGPILQSKRAKELGLDVSLMDRLLARDCYRVDVDTGDYERTIQTRLVRNYRSHPAIVNLYSGLYYNHSLEAFAKPEDVSLCEIWHKSRNKQYPILFHAIYEPSKSDNRSHSLYNFRELHVVMDYVKDLMYFGINGKPVKESDIGIISPYKNQFRRIQEELNLRKWFGIETGSVETFQGKEKQIIIVSFVRSGTDNLGFLDNPRRLNVTLSRPKSLLILIGNPKTLSLNSDFEYIIKECQRNNTFIGGNGTSRADLLQKSTENLATSLESLTQLNKKMQGLKVENKDQRQNAEISKKNRQRRRRRGENDAKSKNKGNSNGKNGVDQGNDENKDDEDQSQDNGNKNSMDTNTDSKKNSRKGNYMRKAMKSGAATGGKVSKQYGKGRQQNKTDKNKNLGESKLDSIFNELPQVPKTCTQTTATNAKEDQFLRLQIQYNQNQLNHNHNNFPNFPTTTNWGRPASGFMNQQQQSNNEFELPQPNATMSNDMNLPMFKNVNTNVLNNKNQNTQNSRANRRSGGSAAGGVSTARNNNLPSSYKNKMDQNNFTKNNYSNSTGAIRKPPKVAANIHRSSSNTNNSSGNTSTKSTKSNNAFNRTSRAAAADAFRDNRNNNRTASNVNSYTTSKSAKPFEDSKDVNKKSIYTSGAINLVSQAKSPTNAITSNPRDIKPVTTANANPVATNYFNTFTTSSGNNINAPSSSSKSGIFSNNSGKNINSPTSSSNVIRPNINSPTSSFNVTRPSSSATLNYWSDIPRNSNFSTSNSNNRRKKPSSGEKDSSCVIS